MKKPINQKRLDYYNKIVKHYFRDQSVTKAEIERRRKAVSGWGIVTTDYNA